MAREISVKAKRLIIQMSAVVLMIAADLGIKHTVQLKLKPVGSVQVIKNVFDLTYTENTGAAWGMMSGRQNLLSAVVAAVLIAMVVYLFISNENGKLWSACFAMIIAGGASNLIDRIVNGFVTDFFRFTFIDFPVFNVADCFIVVGCITLMIYLVADMIKEYGAKKRSVGDTDGNA